MRDRTRVDPNCRLAETAFAVTLDGEMLPELWGFTGHVVGQCAGPR